MHGEWRGGDAARVVKLGGTADGHGVHAHRGNLADPLARRSSVLSNLTETALARPGVRPDLRRGGAEAAHAGHFRDGGGHLQIGRDDRERIHEPLARIVGADRLTRRSFARVLARPRARDRHDASGVGPGHDRRVRYRICIRPASVLSDDAPVEGRCHGHLRVGTTPQAYCHGDDTDKTDGKAHTHHRKVPSTERRRTRLRPCHPASKSSVGLRPRHEPPRPFCEPPENRLAPRASACRKRLTPAEERASWPA